MSCPGRALPEGMRPAEAAMLRRNHSAKNAPRPGPLRVLPPAGASPAGNARSCRNIPASPPLCRRKRPVRRSAGRQVCPRIPPGHASAGAMRFPGPGGACPAPGDGKRSARPEALFQGPRYDKGGGKPPPFFSGGMPLRAFRLQRHRIIRTPGPWRTRSGRCCGGCRRHFPKADNRRQSADRPWGNASALRGLRSCRSCRTHWSTASCRR